MGKPRILYISQEIAPFVSENKLSLRTRHLPQKIQEKGYEIRTFMPNYGYINERRHQLHEVIRLSGINIIINDIDHSLIIKVASIQMARMQVYFIDNDTYFDRKAMFLNKSNKPFEDNDERFIFFCKGVMETVRKLRWIPDIIHCSGWFSSLIPLYLKTKYKNDPVFDKTKVIYSIYKNEIENPIPNTLAEKLKIENEITKEDIDILKNPTINNLHKLAVQSADGIILSDEKIDPEIEQFVNEKDIPLLPYQDEENYVKEYSKFYNQLLVAEESLSLSK